MHPITSKGKTASIVELIFGIIFVLAGITNIRSNALLGIAYIAFGAFLIVCGLEWRRLRSLYGTYATIISNGTAKTISDLASATHSSPLETKETLKRMIKKGLATNVAVDEHSGQIIVGEPTIKSATSIDAAPASAIPCETITAICPGCGAPNKIEKGTKTECEHCGAPISA